MEIMSTPLMPLSLCMVKRPAVICSLNAASSPCTAEAKKGNIRSVVWKMTCGVFLSSSTACLQGMPELSAVLIMVLRAPALINPHRVGLLIARLIACETAPVLPVLRTTFVMDLSIMCDTGGVNSPSLQE